MRGPAIIVGPAVGRAWARTCGDTLGRAAANAAAAGTRPGGMAVGGAERWKTRAAVANIAHSSSQTARRRSSPSNLPVFPLRGSRDRSGRLVRGLGRAWYVGKYLYRLGTRGAIDRCAWCKRAWAVSRTQLAYTLDP